MIKHKRLLALISFAIATNYAMAIEVITPQELQTTTIQINDPDSLVKTLGTVSFQIRCA